MTYYPGLKEYIQDQLLKGIKTKLIYNKAISHYGYNNSLKSFYKYVYKIKNNLIEKNNVEDLISQKFINLLKKRKFVPINEVYNELLCSQTEVYDLVTQHRKMGYEILHNENYLILSSDITSQGVEFKSPLEDKEIVFGVASDLHFGSKECQLTALNEFCEICRKKGVKHIFVPGDICAGINVYPGQQFEVYALSAEEQEESVITNLPYGFDWYMLGGNHDYSFIKRGGGHNPLLAIEAQRPDVHYVGFDEATIPILPGVDMKLWHPAGGVPYSQSYRLQKGVEQIAYSELANISRQSKEKPTVRFLLAGHLHIQLQSMFGSIFGMQCGCFEGQTSFLKRLGLHPQVGGYIVHADLTPSGLLRSFSAKFYMFSHVQNDWKNYNHSLNKSEKIIDPLFS